MSGLQHGDWSLKLCRAQSFVSGYTTSWELRPAGKLQGCVQLAEAIECLAPPPGAPINSAGVAPAAEEILAYNIYMDWMVALSTQWSLF